MWYSYLHCKSVYTGGYAATCAAMGYPNIGAVVSICLSVCLSLRAVFSACSQH